MNKIIDTKAIKNGIENLLKEHSKLKKLDCDSNCADKITKTLANIGITSINIDSDQYGSVFFQYYQNSSNRGEIKILHNNKKRASKIIDFLEQFINNYNQQ